MIHRIDSDLKEAMLSRDSFKVSVLKGIKNSIINNQKTKGEDLTDSEILTILKKEVKQRYEAAQAYTKGGAEDRAKSELKEKEIIQKYMRKMMSESQIIKLVEDAVAEFGSSKDQTGRIIGQVMKKAKGLADGSEVARLVKESQK